MGLICLCFKSNFEVVQKKQYIIFLLLIKADLISRVQMNNTQKL